MAERHIGLSSVVTTSIFTFTFLLIGVPLWWKTTEVYRYPIPHEECQQLLNEMIMHVVPVKVILADRDVQQGVLWEKLLQISEKTKDSVQPAVNFEWTMSTTTTEEENLIKGANDISDLDIVFYMYEEAAKRASIYPKSHGELRIIVLHHNFSGDSKFSVGRSRMGYIINNADSRYLALDVLSLAKKMSLVDRLQKLYTPASSYSGDKKPDKDRMRHLRSSPRFDITFSLFVPEPQILEIHWNIEDAINAYLKPILEELGMIYKVGVKSQILYMTALPMPTHTSVDDKGEFILNSEYLPSLINPIEARLGSDISVHPNLNFVIYIPTKSQTPLQIYDQTGQPLHTNAFLLPQWGGFLIYNCPLPENASLPYRVHLNERIFMEVFLSQFRLLLGLPEDSELADKECQVLPSTGIRKWELDFLLRKNAQEHLSTAVSSLSSLSHLLHSIGNIVIRDDVGEKIYTAVSAVKESLKLLVQGYLKESFLKAQSAFIASEEAFFDPSLLALLYFPEDQKYAIYIPLFLPISIPVATSVARLWRFWKNYKQKLKPD